MSQITKKTGISFGIITTLLITLIYLIVLFYNPLLMASPTVGILIFLLLIVMGTIASYITRVKLKSVTLKEAFIPYFITISISVFATSFILFTLYGLLFTEKALEIKQEMISYTAEQMKNFSVPENVTKISLDEVKKQEPFEFLTLFKSAFLRVIILCIPGIIVALIFRNKSEFSPNKQ